MKPTARRILHTLAMQILVCIAVLLLTPVMTGIISRSLHDSLTLLAMLSKPVLECFGVFLINYWLLGPRLLFRDRRAWFFAANVTLVVVLLVPAALKLFSSESMSQLPEGFWIGLVMMMFFTVLLFSASVVLAVGLLASRRNRLLRDKIREEKERHIEAELVWLRKQISPHFLFNTLNNISSLVAFDSDRAQDSIARLSDLLRYAMYDTDKPFVRLESEADFMQDYIALMSLRNSDRTRVDVKVSIAEPSLLIPPLLLVSLIENAFKHGVSASRDSWIDIDISEADGVLRFSCSNSNHAKGASDRSGSGIGLTNMQRRLELIYPSRYTWKQESTPETFTVKVTLRL